MMYPLEAIRLPYTPNCPVLTEPTRIRRRNTRSSSLVEACRFGTRHEVKHGADRSAAYGACGLCAHLVNTGGCGGACGFDRHVQPTCLCYGRAGRAHSALRGGVV